MDKEVNGYKGPLHGLNVLDFGHYYAGPMVGMLLADQGANVIRIARPGGREIPEQQYRLLNRNKSLLQLDLKTEEGRGEVLSLIERADVLIENFRPGVMKRLGLHYEEVAKKNKCLVYLSLPGFSSTDTKRAHIQAWEGVMSAASCVYTEISWVRQKLNYPPVYSWSPHCSTHGALNGAVAVMAALVARNEHGVGAMIEVPQVRAGLAGFSLDFLGRFQDRGTSNEASLDHLKSFVYRPEDSQEVQQQKLQAAHKADVQWGDPFSTFYQCSDGRKVMCFCPFHPHIIARFLKVLGIYEKVLQEGFVNESTWITTISNNMSNTLGSGGLSPERLQRLKKLIGDVLLTKEASEWEDILGKAGVPLSVVRSRDEWLSLKPILRSGLLVQMENDKSTLIVPGRLADVCGPGGRLISGYREGKEITLENAKSLFANNVSSFNEPRDERPLKKGDLLKGLKVLELANVIAGPSATLNLAEYGARVVKLDPSGTGPFLIFPNLSLGQGKESIMLDVKTKPGREAFERLVSWADVVVHNILDDTAERLGVSQKQLQEINPKVMSCQVSAFGGTYRGWWENRTGFDTVTQSALGVAAHYGTLEEPHVHGGASCGDLTGGMSLAFATLLGVYQQRNTGYAAEVRTALARAVAHYQLPYMISENGSSDWSESHGQFALGDSWYQRLYQCTDGWIYIGATEDRKKDLLELVIGKDVVNVKEIEAKILMNSCSFWLPKLEAEGIASHSVVTLNDILQSYEMRKVSNEEADEVEPAPLELLQWTKHPCGKPISMMGSDKVRVGIDLGWWRPHPAPRLGEHTTTILQELGYSDSDISRLIRIGVACEFAPEMGCKDTYFYAPKTEDG